MKQQRIALVLSALLFSTFGHDVWNHRNSHLNKRQHLSRDNNPNEAHCSWQWVCPPSCDSSTSTTVTPGDNPTTTPTSTSSETPTTSPSTEAPTTSPSTEAPTASPPPDTATNSTPPETLTTSSPIDATTNSTSTETPATSSPGEVTTLPSNEPTSSTLAPSVNGNSSLQIFINASANIVAVYSVQWKVAFVLDTNNHIAALLNGTSGSVIIYNYQTKIGFYLGSSSEVSWLSSREEWSAYWARLDLTVVVAYAQRNGQRFTADSVSTVITAQITYSLTAFGVVVSDGQGALAVWYQISYSWSVVLSASSGGIFKLTGDVRAVVVRGSLSTIVATYIGIAAFIQRAGGVTVFIQKRITINIAVLLSSTSSFDIFVYFVRISRQNNISIDWVGQYKSVFELIASFSGNSTTGINGLVTTLVTLISVAQSRVKIEVAIQALIVYYQNNNASLTVEVVRSYFISVRDQLRVLGYTQLASEVDLFISGKLIVNNVNISLIYTYILQVNVSPLHIIVQILVALQSVIRIQNAIVVLILQIIYLSAQSNGSAIIGILLNIRINISGNLLLYIVQNLTIRAILNIRLVFGILSRLQILGQVITTINAALGSVTSVQQIILQQVAVFIRLVTVLIRVRSSGSVTSITASGSFSVWYSSTFSIGFKEHHQHERNHLSAEAKEHHLDTKHLHDKHYNGHEGHERHHEGHERHHEGHEKLHEGHDRRHHFGNDKHIQQHGKHHQEHESRIA